MSDKPAPNKHDPHDVPADQLHPLIAAEYKALRDELLKRIEFRYQIINLTLVSAGTLLAAGTRDGVSASVLLVYPLVAAFLASGWTHNGDAIIPIARYIREELEVKIVGSGWESYLSRHPDRRFLYEDLGVIYAAGIFLSTQLIALTLGALKATASAPDVVLLIGDFLAVGFTVSVLLLHRRARRKAYPSEG